MIAPPRRWDPTQELPRPAGRPRGEAPWTAPVRLRRAGRRPPAGGRPRAAALPAASAPRPSCRRPTSRAVGTLAGRHRQLPRRAHRSRPAGPGSSVLLIPGLQSVAAPARVDLVAWPRRPAASGWTGRRATCRTQRELVHVAARQLHVRQQVRDDPAHPGQRPAAGGRGRAAARPADPPPGARCRRAADHRAEPEDPGEGPRRRRSPAARSSSSRRCTPATGRRTARRWRCGST